MTIVCREVIAFLDDYVADALAAEHRREFDRHLVICVSCVAYLASYRETIRLAKAAHPPEIEDVPPDVIAAILATITRE